MTNKFFTTIALRTVLQNLRSGALRRRQTFMLSLFLLGFSISAKAQCDELASFTFENPITCSPCFFQFTSQFSAISHFWDFGDGTTSTAMNPQHTYTNSGTYPVVHQVTTQSPSGQMYIQECKKNVQANCGSSVQVQERIECCELVFYLDACNSSNNGCTDYWEIVNTQGVVCLTSNDVSPVFHLRNIHKFHFHLVQIISIKLR